ncbi:unnamed protein product [Phytophthora fragariaefolia]|uniref:Unnamed protein product n=1 Tax=Phytophthora fragariaefolia TaxID=1490495 RepID=A0A9W6YJA6_9STRA|nr:unnamed protein product [Phytophthora fragariaefolia]
MRPAVLLVLVMISSILHAAAVTSHAGPINKNSEATATNTKFIELQKLIHRLRGSAKRGDEERNGAVAAASLSLGMGAYSHARPTSQHLLHSAEYVKPMPKWMKGLVAIVGIGAVAGIVYGSTKLSALLSDTLDK